MAKVISGFQKFYLDALECCLSCFNLTGSECLARLVVVEQPVVVERGENGGVTSDRSIFVEERDLTIRVEKIGYLGRERECVYVRERECVCV